VPNSSQVTAARFRDKAKGNLISLLTTSPRARPPSCRGFLFLAAPSDQIAGIGETADRFKMRKPTLAERWAKMAEEARAIAMRTRDPATKETMLEIAASYDGSPRSPRNWRADAPEKASRHPTSPYYGRALSANRSGRRALPTTSVLTPIAAVLEAVACRL
jgi:hypothetical protein